jgi:hypothetical protein
MDKNLKAALEALTPEDRLAKCLELIADEEPGYSKADLTAAYHLINAASDGLPAGSDTRDTSGQANQSDNLEQWLAEEIEKLTPEDPAKPTAPKKPVSAADSKANGNNGIGSGNPVMSEVTEIYLQHLKGIH